MPKQSSGIKRDSGQSRTKKAIAALNQRAVELGIAKRADFTGLDVAVAEEMITQIQAAREMFPQLMELDFVGSFTELERTFGVDLKAPEGAIGVFHHKWGPPAGLALNDKRCSPKELTALRESLKRSVSEHYSPDGCDTIKSVIDHEIGHWMDHSLLAFRDRRIGKIFKPLYDDPDEMPMVSALSRYAKRSRSEFIAEAWREYRNNPTPRPVAKAVGDRLIELYRKGTKK